MSKKPDSSKVQKLDDQDLDTVAGGFNQSETLASSVQKKNVDEFGGTMGDEPAMVVDKGKGVGKDAKGFASAGGLGTTR